MAQDAVDQAETMAGFEERRCTTEHLQIHGWTKQQITTPNLRCTVLTLRRSKNWRKRNPVLAERLHPDLPYIGAEVVWAVRQEMARTVEDVLARRTRALLLGARASIEAAPKVAQLMGRELGADEAWQRESAAKFANMAQGYVLN